MVNTVSTSRSAPDRWVKTFAFMFWDKLKAHALLIVLCIIFFIASYIMNLSMGREMGQSAGAYLGLVFWLILPIAIASSLILVFLYLLIIKRPKSPTKAMINFYRPLVTDPQRYANALTVISCMLLSFIAFADMKPLIPMINDYSWDETFMRLDRFIHFGHDPWRLLAPIFGHPIPTQWINYIYNIWLLVMFTFWMGAAWSNKTHLKHKSSEGWERQFLISFILCWIVGGMVFATLFSSMGPAFYDLVNSANNPYAAQVMALGAIHETHNLWAVDTHAMLREAYLNPAPGQLSGISAMPSVHNATSTLFMLAAYRINKNFGHIMAVFLGFIIIGSVHLAWHYAVDAYAGIVIALILWWVAGKLLPWQDRLVGRHLY